MIKLSKKGKVIKEWIANEKIYLACFLALLLPVLIFTAAFAHPAYTDVNGGQEDY